MRRTLVLLLVAAVPLACGDDATEDVLGGADAAVSDDSGSAESEQSSADESPAEEGSDGAPDESSESTSAEPTTTEVPDDDPGGIEWEATQPGLETGILDVPLDYSDAEAGSIELYLVRHRAADPDRRIGSLLVNPGGPGAGGSILAEVAEDIYGDDLLDRFDIIGWDPRGTGLSEPYVDCVDEYDPYFGIDSGPDDSTEEQALQDALTDFAAGCAERSGDLLSHISTADSARDMDAIRQALGEDTISYFGWSYGTSLGATWATLFPDTVRAAVLDGAVDPTVGRVDGLVDQSAGFEATFGTFLADCAADPSCPINNGGDPRAVFVELLTRIELEEIPTEPGRPPLTAGIVEFGVANALYSDTSWPALAQALADAVAGDGAGLLAQYDEYMVRLPDGTYTNDLEAYFAISCADEPDTDGVDAAVAVRDRFVTASPLIGSTAAAEVLVCAVWPPVESAPVEVTGVGAGPIVVVGNTGDPATPFEGSRRMAEALEGGVFVAVEADQHTAYGLNPCIDGLIESYLTDLEVPAEGSEC